MLSKCANPACSTPLVYLREGKIFMMEHAREPEAPGQSKGPGKVEHFWLCGPCSAQMTLVYDSRAGVRMQPKARSLARAAS
jgi:hypothetical protein